MSHDADGIQALAAQTPQIRRTTPIPERSTNNAQSYDVTNRSRPTASKRRKTYIASWCCCPPRNSAPPANIVQLVCTGLLHFVSESFREIKFEIAFKLTAADAILGDGDIPPTDAAMFKKRKRS